MFHVHHWRAMALILAVFAVGCSKCSMAGTLTKVQSTLTEGAEKVKQVAGETMETTTQQVEKQLNLAGSVDLTAGQPLKINACYVSWIPQGSGRATVLQLQSYRDADREQPPFVFLQAHVQANSIAELIGEPLDARLFVQREAQGPILFSEFSTPIKFKITSVKDQTVSVELTEATLWDTSTGAEIPVTGSMTGVLE